MLEQHPVPQNVTNFQFRLVGDMTLKQFGYLAAGAILAYISYNLPLPFFFTWPLTALFALGGIGFAFVPIEERPMDVWFLSFIKGVYSPTLYIWQREAPVQPPPPGAAQGILKNPLPTIPLPDPTTIFPFLKKKTSPQAMWSAKQGKTGNTGVSTNQRVNETGQQSLKVSMGQQNTGTTTLPTSDPVLQSLTVNNHLPQINQPINNVGSKTTVVTDTAPPHPSSSSSQLPEKKMNTDSLQASLPIPPHTDPKNTPTELELAREKQKEQEARIKELEEALKKLQQPVAQPGTPTNPNTQSTNLQPTTHNSQPFTYPPNMIMGSVRDMQGVMLQNILITVKDQNHVPVRALKTNKSGQFASSTPLPSAQYIIEIEDPKNQYLFDSVTVSLEGVVLSPLQIIAKTQKQIEREKLEKALFGKNQ